MYGERPIGDAVRTLRALATNQVARFAPRTYLNLTAQTGRGAAQCETPAGVAQYFLRSFYDYFEVLHVRRDDIADYLRGKTLLEYGPGDTPGVALLMVAHGAQKVFCVDRFPMLSHSRGSARVLRELLESLPAEFRARGEAAIRLDGDDAVSMRPDYVQYLVRPSGLCGLRKQIDLAFSRAVLEHVDDVHATFADMAAALKPGGTAIHQADLKSHGLHRRNPLDFLSWPQPLWQLMYSHKGMPNRWRVNHYREAIGACGLKLESLSPTGRASRSDIEEVRPHLAAPFRDLSDEDLAWLGFWLVCRK
jgi:SAM-dependent methyltransferase